MLFRKLFIAAFVIAALALCSVSFADVVTPIPKDTKGEKVWITNPARDYIVPGTEVPAGFDRGTDGDFPYVGTYSKPGTYGTDTTTNPCPTDFDYSGNLVGAYTRLGGDTRELAMRFSIPASHSADIYGVWILINDASDTSTNPLEDPVEVRLRFYGDDGGVPNDLDVIHDEILSELPAALTPGWHFIDMTSTGLVISGTEEFHIGMLSVGSPEEYVQFVVSDGANNTGRGSYRSSGVWASTLAVLGVDRTMALSCVYCYYYSNCAFDQSLMTFTGPGYVGVGWFMPETAFGGTATGCSQSGFGQRWVSEGPDSLKSVLVRHFDRTTTYQPIFPASGANDLIVQIWNDDGTGQIDEGSGPLATEVVSGRANLFPQTGGDGTLAGTNYVDVDFSSYNLIMLGPWHVTARMSSGDDALGLLVMAQSYEFDCPAGPYCTDGFGASIYWDGAYGACAPGWEREDTNADWLGIPETDYAYSIYATLCRDEFSDCQTQLTYDAPPFNWYEVIGTTFDGSGGSIEWEEVASLVVGGPVNKLDKMRFLIDWWDNAVPAAGMTFYAWAPNGSGGSPGTVLYSEVVPAASLVLYPGWHEVVIPGGLIVPGDFYIGYGVDPATYDPADRLAGTSEDQNTLVNGGWWGKSDLSAFGPFTPASIWYNATDIGWTDNLIAEADFCSIPLDERACFDAGVNHTSFGLDQNRTGAADIALGDAWCDLTLDWSYRNAGKNIVFAAPLIYNDFVVCSFGDEYKVLDLLSGAVVETITGSPQVGAGLRCTPMITTVDIGFGPEDVLIISGGSTRNISLYHWSDVVDGGGATAVWTSPFGTTDCRYGGLTVVDAGGTVIVTWTTEDGNIYASLITDGTFWGDWTSNPVALGLNTVVGGTTDGTDVYYTTVDNTLAIAAGDIYKLDATDGSIIWQLSVDGDLYADDLYSTITAATNAEGFWSAVAYDPALDVIYANSSTVDGDHPADGVFYVIDAASGAVNSAAISARSLYTVPIIDQTRIYVNSFSRWVAPPAGGNLLAFRRPQGDLSWVSGSAPIPAPSYRAQMALSCEPGFADLLFAFDEASANAESGFLSCFNADTGDEIFRRRIDHLATALNSGGAVSLGKDSNGDTRLLAVDIAGDIYCLTNTGVDRPRFEIQAYKPEVPVEFGFNPLYMVTVENILYNSGCATLTMDSVHIDTVDAVGSSVPDMKVAKSELIRPDAVSFANSIVNKLSVKNPLANDAFALNLDDLNNQFAVTGEKGYNTSAMSAAALDFLVGVSAPLSIAAGDSADITLTIDQTVLDRGPHPFYISFHGLNDPDFFLNNVVSHLDTLVPRMLMTVVGGCLIDTITLDFGMGGANYQWVTNTGRLGTGDWDAHGIEIDGDGASYYQGSYIYGVDKYRLAMNTQDWTSGGGEGDGFFSMQADPNWCDDACSPFLSTVCELGEISDDGLTYTPISGGAVCKTYVDSVQSFYAAEPLDDNWDWDAGKSTIIFDDTLTIGLIVNTTTYGALDVPSLANFTLEIMTFTERNGNAVPDWYFGSFHDYDVGGDVMNWNADISAGWSANAVGGPTAFGQIKIPFGCGYDPMRGTVEMYGNDGLWTANPYYDSSYLWMSTRLGLDLSHPNTGDEQGHHSIAGHDFEAYGSFTLAVAFFGLTDLTDAQDAAEIAPLAHAANKWAGFGRGDVDNDDAVTIADIIYLNRYVGDPGTQPGPIPFMHLGDVDGTPGIDVGDVTFLKNYYFECGPCPIGAWADWTGCDPNP